MELLASGPTITWSRLMEGWYPFDHWG